MGTRGNSDNWYMVSYLSSRKMQVAVFNLMDSFFLHLHYHSNFGKLNYFLGARAKQEGRRSRYPSIDFCKTPDAICNSEEHIKMILKVESFFELISLKLYSFFRNAKCYIYRKTFN